MKLSSFLPLGLSALALAAPTQKLYPRENSTGASATDSPTIGYATENGGTTGGAGGQTVTVSSVDDLRSAVKGDDPAIVIIASSLTGSDDKTEGTIKVGSNKTILGKDSSIVLDNLSLTIKEVSNVIVRNVAIQKCTAPKDNIAIQKSTNVWIDHVDLSSDRDHDKDYYDGLLDLTHAADFITISNSKLHDHWKGSLVGHSDSNGDEDTGHLRVTYYNNHWSNVNSRGPSIRFGTVHVFNNYFESVNDGINTRDGAQVLAENNVWVDSDKPLYAVDDNGYAVATGNDFGGAENTAPEGTLTSVPYKYDLVEASAVKSAVSSSGNTLSF